MALQKLKDETLKVPVELQQGLKEILNDGLFKFCCRNCCMQKLLWLKGSKESQGTMAANSPFGLGRV